MTFLRHSIKHERKGFWNSSNVQIGKKSLPRSLEDEKSRSKTKHDDISCVVPGRDLIRHLIEGSLEDYRLTPLQVNT